MKEMIQTRFKFNPGLCLRHVTESSCWDGFNIIQFGYLDIWTLSRSINLTAFYHECHGRILGRVRGGRGPPFFFYFQNFLWFCFENRFIKCSLILSSETLTLLYFVSRIRPQCCMLHVLKSFHSGGKRGEGGGLGSLFLNFLDPPLNAVQVFSDKDYKP